MKFKNSRKSVRLKEPTSTSYLGKRDDHHPRKAIDRKMHTFFALKGGTIDGYWKSDFPRE